jgi:hypothetical protein
MASPTWPSHPPDGSAAISPTAAAEVAAFELGLSGHRSADPDLDPVALALGHAEHGHIDVEELSDNPHAVRLDRTLRDKICAAAARHRDYPRSATSRLSPYSQ